VDGGSPAVCTFGTTTCPDGTLNPMSVCQRCETAIAADVWTDLPEGTPCSPQGPGGAQCHGGRCVQTCSIGANKVLSRASNPDDPSVCCNPSLDAFGWSTRLVQTNSLTVPGDLNELAAGDFNHDGWLDLAAASAASVSVYLNVQGTLQPGVIYPVGAEARSIVAVDLNRDGFLDLVTENATSRTLSVLINRGDGTFAAAVDYPSGTAGYHSLKSGDFNGDKIPDLVCGAESLLFFQGVGDGSLLPAVVVGDQPQGELAVANLVLNGTPDVAEAAFYAGGVTPFLSSGSGFVAGSTMAASVSTPSNLQDLVAADLNGDGIPDLAVATRARSGDDIGSVGILLGKGDGTFWPWSDVPLGTGVSSLAMADLDGDGRGELLFANGTIYQLDPADGGVIQIVLSPQPGINRLLTGDFNNDGADDIAGRGGSGVVVFVNGCP
jgi:hypothetical protein